MGSIMVLMANVNTTRVKVTLPEQLYFYVRSRADKYGMTTAAYIKSLILNDVKDLDLPSFRMSKKREEVALAARDEYRQGKTHEIGDVDEFLGSL